MTIEEKAQRYDEAIKTTRKWYDANTNEGYRGIFEDIFPELKNSEDKNEKIRQALIKLVTNHASMDLFIEYDIHLDEAIAWLEKQGEQKPKKNEPKFKVGDWMVSPNGVYWHIDAINNNRYEVSSTDGVRADWPLNTNLYHLWSIQDAKDGDVLSDGTTIFIFKDLLSDGSVMSYCDYDADNGESDAFCHLSMNLICSKITPSTKEQCDLLFSKMKEAGFEWDAKKKEMKKIKQRIADNIPQDFEKYVEHLLSLSDGEGHGSPAKVKEVSAELFKLAKLEQNTAWSEEDEMMIKFALTHFRKTGATEDSDIIKWLKSLKDRYTKKPIEDHYELEEFAKIVRGNLTGISRAVIERFETKYLQLTGNKMFGGFKD